MGRGNFEATDREMKLCSSLLFSAAAVTAQYADDASADRWGGAYEYDSGFTYPAGVKDDGGNSAPTDFDGLNHFNGLHCWMCDERLDLGTEAETSTVNAYARCLLNGMVMKCRVSSVHACSRSAAATVSSTPSALVASRPMPAWPCGAVTSVSLCPS